MKHRVEAELYNWNWFTKKEFYFNLTWQRHLHIKANYIEAVTSKSEEFLLKLWHSSFIINQAYLEYLLMIATYKQCSFFIYNFNYSRLVLWLLSL